MQGWPPKGGGIAEGAVISGLRSDMAFCCWMALRLMALPKGAKIVSAF